MNKQTYTIRIDSMERENKQAMLDMIDKNHKLQETTREQADEITALLVS